MPPAEYSWPPVEPASRWRRMGGLTGRSHEVVGRPVTGRSLRDDDAPLHDEVELLFKRRNDAAHRGKLPPSDEAFNPVATASRLFDWLNAL